MKEALTRCPVNPSTLPPRLRHTEGARDTPCLIPTVFSLIKFRTRRVSILHSHTVNGFGCVSLFFFLLFFLKERAVVNPARLNTVALFYCTHSHDSLIAELLVEFSGRFLRHPAGTHVSCKPPVFVGRRAALPSSPLL